MVSLVSFSFNVKSSDNLNLTKFSLRALVAFGLADHDYCVTERFHFFALMADFKFALRLVDAEKTNQNLKKKKKIMQNYYSI